MKMRYVPDESEVPAFEVHTPYHTPHTITQHNTPHHNATEHNTIQYTTPYGL
jgi:hypothetical protein